MKGRIFIALIMLITIGLYLPAAGWIYPDCTQDDKYEKFGPRADRLLINLYSDSAALFSALENGQIDLESEPLTREIIDKWSSPPYNENIKLVLYQPKSMVFIDINCYRRYPGAYERGAQGEDNPTRVPCMRHALWHLMNRTYVVEEIYGGLAVPIYTPVPPSLPAYQHPEIIPGGAMEVLTHPYDPAYANQILNNCDQDPADGMPDFPINPDTGWRFWDKNGDGVEQADEYLELWFYIRIDDPLRHVLGDWFADQIECGVHIHVNRRYVDAYGAWYSVMLAHEHNLYINAMQIQGWLPDHLKSWHSDYNLCNGMNCSTYDYYIDRMSAASSLEEYKEYCLNAQQVFNSPYTPEEGYTCDCPNGAMASIPVLASLNYKACWRRYTGGTAGEPVTPDDGENLYRNKTWLGIVNMPTHGIDNFWTFLNIHPKCHLVGDCQNMTVRYGMLNFIDRLNPLYAASSYSWRILDFIYEKLVISNPYVECEFTPWIVKNYEIATWIDPVSGEEKTKIILRLHPNICWTDGTSLTAEDIKFTLKDISHLLEEHGYPQPSWFPHVPPILSMDILDPFTVRILFDEMLFSPSLLTELSYVPILPKHVWHWIITNGDPTEFAPDPNMIGSGPYRLLQYEEGNSVVLVANKPGLTVQTNLPGSFPVTNPYGYFRLTPLHVNIHTLLTFENLTIFHPESPIGSEWHMLKPWGCYEFELSDWKDDGNGILDQGDWISLTPIGPAPPHCPSEWYSVFKLEAPITKPDNYTLLISYYRIKFNMPHRSGQPPTIDKLPIEFGIELYNLWLNQCSGGYLIVNKYVYYSPPNESTWCGPSKLVLLPGYPKEVTLKTLSDGTIIIDKEVIQLEIKSGDPACGNPAWIVVAVHIKGPEMLDSEHPNPWICRWINVTLPIAVTIREDTCGAFYCGNDQIPTPDFKVDLYDIYRTAMAFASYPGHPYWNPVHDITCDYQVDLADYYAICQMFGWEAPDP